MTEVRDLFLVLASMIFCLWAFDNRDQTVRQTEALQQIARNSNPPVSITLDGFSDDARATLVNALKEQPKQKKGK